MNRRIGIKHYFFYEVQVGLTSKHAGKISPSFSAISHNQVR